VISELLALSLLGSAKDSGRGEGLASRVFIMWNGSDSERDCWVPRVYGER
jgi:hypothetical protein